MIAYCKGALCNTLNIAFITFVSLIVSLVTLKLLSLDYNFLSQWETLLGTLISIPVTLGAILHTNTVTREATQKQIEAAGAYTQKQIEAMQETSKQELEAADKRQKQREQIAKAILIRRLVEGAISRYIITKNLLEMLKKISAEEKTPLHIHIFSDDLFPSEIYTTELLLMFDAETLDFALRARQEFLGAKRYNESSKNYIVTKEYTPEEQRAYKNSFLLFCVLWRDMEKYLRKISNDTIHKIDIHEDFLEMSSAEFKKYKGD